MDTMTMVGVNKFTHPRTAEVITAILTDHSDDLIASITSIKLVIENALAAYKAAKAENDISALGQRAFYRDGFNAIMKERVGEDNLANVERAISGWRAHALFRAVCADEVECSKRALNNAARWF